MNAINRVLFLVRDSFAEIPGGDRVQVLKTKKYLERLFQIPIDLKTSKQVSPQDLKKYDLIHAFGLVFVQDFQWLLRQSAGERPPIVLSPIYWNSTILYRQAYYGFRNVLHRTMSEESFYRVRSLKRLLQRQDFANNWRSLLVGELTLRRQLLDASSVILPNSRLEVAELRREFDLPQSARMTVIVNAVDVEDLRNVENVPDNVAGRFKGSVVCAARIDERKNVLRVVEALADQSFQVFIIGKVNPESQPYFERIKQIAKSNIHILDEMSQIELFQVFRAATVHVLPSWYETPGLSNLEAAAFGCQLAISRNGSTQEYFGDLAYYCDPKSPESILQATQAAFAAGKNALLSDKVRTQYTWEVAAETTYAAYSQVLAEGRK